MKKRILVINDSLKAGGAERSCVNFLSLLPEEEYEIDVLLHFRAGIFIKQLPSWVKLVDAPYPYSCLAHKPKEWEFYIQHPPVIWIKKIVRTWRAKHQHKLHLHQSLWQLWKNGFPIFPVEYDIVIGGQEGISNYYALEKVRAKKKIIWIHSDYDKIGFDRTFDSDLFPKADIIATISPIAREKLRNNFPEIADRIRFIGNITNPVIVKRMGTENITENYFTESGVLKLISCGRLAQVKAYDRAVLAASILKNKGIKFQWVIIGEGEEKNRLIRLIEILHVSDVIHLIGLRENPYSYMNRADVLVVTSDYEGLPMVIDEAQILGKPIVTTNYPTVADAVSHENTGLICKMNPESIANAIIRLHRNKELYNHIKCQLEKTKNGNVLEIKRYIEMFEN